MATKTQYVRKHGGNTSEMREAFAKKAREPD
jgi:hypothetical protein